MEEALLLLELNQMRKDRDNHRQMFTLGLLKLQQERQRALHQAIEAASHYDSVPRPFHEKNSGFWENIVPCWDDERFRKKFRVTRVLFQKLTKDLGPLLYKETKFSKERAITVKKRIAIALTALKSCGEYGEVGDKFGVGKTSVHNCFKQFLHAMDEVYGQSITWPSHDEQKKIATEFEDHWGYPMAVGSIDGCHVKIYPPKAQKTSCYNYKHFYSSLLLAVVDARGKFLYIHVGTPGRANDVGILNESQLWKKLESETLLPPSTRLIENKVIPYHILADSAFPLKPFMIKTYAEHHGMSPEEAHFNACHSKARRVVENAFGRLKCRWRKLYKGLECKWDDIYLVIKVCCLLHNLCEEGQDRWQLPEHVGFGKEVPANEPMAFQVTGRNRGKDKEAADIRDALMVHFNRLRTLDM